MRKLLYSNLKHRRKNLEYA